MREGVILGEWAGPAPAVVPAPAVGPAVPERAHLICPD